MTLEVAPEATTEVTALQIMEREEEEEEGLQSTVSEKASLMKKKLLLLLIMLLLQLLLLQLLLLMLLLSPQYELNCLPFYVWMAKTSMLMNSAFALSP